VRGSSSPGVTMSLFNRTMVLSLDEFQPRGRRSLRKRKRGKEEKRKEVMQREPSVSTIHIHAAVVLYQADEWSCDRRPSTLRNSPGLEGKKPPEPIERETTEVSKRGATTRDSAFKLFEPNVWMLGVCFNVRAYTVAASTRSAPAASSRRSAHLCSLPYLRCSWPLHTCR
jgi:hypothetical protein